MIKKTTAAIISLLLVQISGFGHIPFVFAEIPVSHPTIKAEEWPLEKVLQRIESTRRVSFAYQKKFIEDKYVIYKPLRNENIELYLTELLGPLGLAFKKIESVEEDIFVIFPQAESSETSFEATSDDRTETFVPVRQTISGRVEGEGVGPLTGVNVVFQTSGIGTTTDEKGMFSIDLPPTSEPLIFSFIGYESSVIRPHAAGELKVVLKESPQPLNEVVVTAMGIDREQRTLGYSVARLDMKPIATTGNTNFASALYGRAPGVRIKTAPGGATSAVTVQIRGLSSLNYNTQPLYVINGVVMRDGNDRGAAGLNNADYFTDQRIRGNGILDIPVSDIETVTILKGASATALYGSDAANGVVVLTTKNGEASKGVGVSFNYHYSVEEAAFLPKFQNIYGPGFNRSRNLALGATAEGWVPVSETPGAYRPMFESQAQFGPEMNGQEVLWWDGSVRKYQPQPDNYQNFFRKGKNSIYHIAFGDRTERMQYRVSYTRNDYEGIQQGSKLERNNVSFNSQVPLSRRLSANVAVLYSNSYVHNRPFKINRLTSSWSGFFSRAEDMSLLLDKYQTSDRYKWVPYDQPQRNPNEALKYVTPKGYEVMDLLWKQLRNSEDEFQDRWISSASLNFQLADNLNLLARAGSDFTSLFIDRRQYSEYSSRFNGATSTGYYGNSNGRYSLFYTDALLDFSKSLSNQWDVSVKGGIQSRQEDFSDKSVGTSGGLQTENWFSLENSFAPELSTSSSKLQTLKYAFLGIVNAGFKNALFIEGTGRREYSSTLPPGHGSYFYPSVNSSFVFSEFVNLPAMLNYGRLRASYGIVGNSPPAYESNFSYQSTNIYTPSGVVTSVSAVGDPYGNDNIRPERKHEVEFGLEALAFNSKVSVELTYYSNRIKDQIVRLNLPTSTGAKRILTNAGELQSSGWEAGITARPVSGRFVWTSGTNAAFNNTIVRKLSNGIGQMVFRELEGSSIKVVAEEGQKVGNIYVYPRTVDAEGNYVISDDGLYIIDKTRYVKAGNIMPVVTGGFLNNLTFRNIEFDFLIDYSFGGDMISPPMKYGTAAGLYESTLKYRTEANGGLPYYIDASGEKTLLESHNGTAPDGSEVFHDGVLLEGVTEEGQVNNTVVDAATYYINSFDWGNNAWNEGAAIYRNNYVKLREASLGYTLPDEWVQRMYFQNIKVSLTGRNLFYLWRTVKNADPETTIGSHWLNQGIDEGSMAATRSYGFTINLGF